MPGNSSRVGQEALLLLEVFLGGTVRRRTLCQGRHENNVPGELGSVLSSKILQPVRPGRIPVLGPTEKRALS